MKNIYLLNKRRILIPMLLIVLNTIPMLCWAVPVLQFKSHQSGAWATPSTWDQSTDGQLWVQSNLYVPNEYSGSVTILNGHNVSLTGNQMVNNLTLDAGSVLDLGINQLTVLGTTTLNGTLKLLINSATVFGNILSNSSATINVAALSIDATADVNYTPTSISTYTILSTPNGGITGDIDILNLALPWVFGNWGIGIGNKTWELEYDPTPTAIHTASSSPLVIVSNGKLIYNGGTVYTLMGRKVASSQVKQELSLKPGVYLVKLSNCVQKIIVK